MEDEALKEAERNQKIAAGVGLAAAALAVWYFFGLGYFLLGISLAFLYAAYLWGLDIKKAKESKNVSEG